MTSSRTDVMSLKREPGQQRGQEKNPKKRLRRHVQKRKKNLIMKVLKMISHPRKHRGQWKRKKGSIQDQKNQMKMMKN